MPAMTATEKRSLSDRAVELGLEATVVRERSWPRPRRCSTRSIGRVKTRTSSVHARPADSPLPRLGLTSAPSLTCGTPAGRRTLKVLQTDGRHCRVAPAFRVVGGVAEQQGL